MRKENSSRVGHLRRVSELSGKGESKTMTEPLPVRVWQIGPDGTEYYAAHSEEEMKRYYRALLGPGNRGDAIHDLKHNFKEVGDLDEEFEFDDDGEKKTTTWRKLAESAGVLPCIISTGYN